MFCAACGKQLPDNAKFCNSCGNPTAAPKPAAQPDPPTQEPPPVHGARDQPPNAPPPIQSAVELPITPPPIPLATEQPPKTPPNNPPTQEPPRYAPPPMPGIEQPVYEHPAKQPAYDQPAYGQPAYGQLHKRRDSIAVRVVVPMLSLVLLTIIFTFVVFLIVDSSPGDPVRIMLGADTTDEEIEQYREELGMNEPVITRYWRSLLGDLGTSYTTGQPVSDIIKARLPSTITLILASLIITFIIALPLGILSAVKRGKAVDIIFKIFSVICKSVPFFWLSLLLVLLFSVKFMWLPVGGTDTWAGYVIPVITLVFSYVGFAMQAVRATAIRAINYGNKGLFFQESDDAYSVGKGVKVQNAMLPSIAKSGLQLSWLVIGVVVVDTISSIPGIGNMLMTGLMTRDSPVIYGGIMAFSLCFLIAAAVFSLIVAGIIFALRLKPAK